jgi:hypothetical protein
MSNYKDVFKVGQTVKDTGCGGRNCFQVIFDDTHVHHTLEVEATGIDWVVFRECDNYRQGTVLLCLRGASKSFWENVVKSWTESK